MTPGPEVTSTGGQVTASRGGANAAGVRRTPRWKRSLRDKRGPAIHPGETLVALAAWWIPALLAAGGLVLLHQHEVRLGVTLMAVGAGVGAVVRAVVPERVAGGLVIRSRVVDVLMWGAMAGLLWFMAGAIHL